MKKTVLLILAITLLPVGVHVYPQEAGHQQGAGLNSPSSPNTGAFINDNVDLFRGTCQVSIPLYNLQNRSVSHPIGLSYVAPEKESAEIFFPGWTGLGWNLAAGGVISRTVRGRPDEYTPKWPQDNDVTLDPPDYFSFNFCGHSGQFFFRGGWQPLIDSQSDILLVEVLYRTSYDQSGRDLTGFKMHMADGTIYTFGGGTSINSTSIELQQGVGPISWYLTSIESDDGDKITFRYDKDDADICTLTGKENKVFFNIEPLGSAVTLAPEKEKDYTPIYYITPVYLSKIICGRISVEFDRSVSKEKRYPASYYPKDVIPSQAQYLESLQWYKLDRIRVMEDGYCFLQYDLNYKENASEVLKLTGVNITGSDPKQGQISLVPYSMKYSPGKTGSEDPYPGSELMEELHMPSGGFKKYIYARNDYWRSYYNGNEERYYGLGYRIEKILAYSDTLTSPEETWYIYDGAAIGRTENHSRTFGYFTIYGDNVDRWSKSSEDFDMSADFFGSPKANQVGYSRVEVKNYKQAVSTGDEHATTAYTFSNYEGYPEGISQGAIYIEGQREKYYKVGLLIHREDSEKRTTYEYGSLGEPSVINQLNVDYLNFNHKYGEFNKSEKWYQSYDYTPVKVKRITEFTSGQDTLRTTCFDYNPDTRNLVKKTENIPAGDKEFTTEYYYHYENSFDFFHENAIKRLDQPYEVITRNKRGEVIAADVYHLKIANSKNLKPVHHYRFENTAGTLSYQRAQCTLYTFISKDPGCRLVESFGYNNNGWLIWQQTPGQQRIEYSWEYKYKRPAKVTVGDRTTSYEYNLFGPTLITYPDGTKQEIRYDALGRKTLIKDGLGRILEKTNYLDALNR